MKNAANMGLPSSDQKRRNIVITDLYFGLYFAGSVLANCSRRCVWGIRSRSLRFGKDGEL